MRLPQIRKPRQSSQAVGRLRDSGEAASRWMRLRSCTSRALEEWFDRRSTWAFTAILSAGPASCSRILRASFVALTHPAQPTAPRARFPAQRLPVASLDDPPADVAAEEELDAYVLTVAQHAQAPSWMRETARTRHRYRHRLGRTQKGGYRSEEARHRAETRLGLAILPSGSLQRRAAVLPPQERACHTSTLIAGLTTLSARS